MSETWGQWLRGNIDKFMLLGLLGVWATLIVHAIHDKSDMDNVHWLRESANTVQGTLLGLITGATLASRREPPPGTVSQTTVKTTIQEAPAPETSGIL